MTIAFLGQAPIRRTNLAGLRIGRHLLRTGAGWTVLLSGDETKNKREMEYVLSASLSCRLDRYLQAFRPVFLNSAYHDGLWASVKGAPMSSSSLYDAVCRRTRARFGRSVNLHLFRDAAATFLAENEPGQVGMVRDLLGHADHKTAEQHYNHARTIWAGRTLAGLIAEKKRQQSY